jgi:hypothetical protein
MLTLMVPLTEGYNEATKEFVTEVGVTLELEHSLVSLSKWESKFKVPFLGLRDKTSEEVLWYIRTMCLSPGVSPEVFNRLKDPHLQTINEYIGDKMTATTFGDESNDRHAQETITAEIIYYWMIELNVPFECQYWHLNRLLTLIRVINLKRAPKKTMNRQDMLQRRRDLNAQRRAQLGTTG